MKKLINIIALYLIAFSVSAVDIESINNEIRNDININHFSKSRVILETGFGSSVFMDENVYQELIGKDIMKVNLVYTTYREANDFDQINLNDKRWQNLFKLMPDVKNNDEIRFKEIGIDKCKLQKCAENQLHGFIIEYRKETFNYTNLEIQKNIIKCEEVNEIKGTHGTKVKIPANAFVDMLGNEVHGAVEVQLREALSPIDIVSAKLLTITDDFQPLESGGMIEINAISNGRKLKLQDGKSISISIPKKKKSPDMKVWEGTWKEGQLQWQKPKGLIGDEPEQLDSKVVMPDVFAQIVEDEDIDDKRKLLPSITIDLGQSPKDKGIQVVEVNFNAINNVLDDVQVIATEDTMLFCKDDYIFSVGLDNGLSDVQAIRIQRWFENELIPNDIPFDFWGWNIVTTSSAEDVGQNNALFVRGAGGNQMPRSVIGLNTGYVSTETAYAFNTTEMGWANIDRLASFPNSKPAKLEVFCVNDSKINNIEVLLVIPKRNIFLPGYKMKNGNYCFSHGDYERKYNLPVGDKAFVVMTGVQDDQGFSTIKKITLGKKDVEETKFIPKDKKATLKELKKLI